MYDLTIIEQCSIVQRWFIRYKKMIATPESCTGQENHHVVPSSIGGADDISNILRCSRRKHFLLHYVLWKMFAKGTTQRKSMAYAFKQMKRAGKKSRLYSKHRLEIAEYVSQDKKNNQYCKGLKTCYDAAGKIRRFKEIPVGYTKGLPQQYKENVSKRTSSKIKINDGINEIWHDASTPIPIGWSKGRTSTFKDIVRQAMIGNQFGSANKGKPHTTEHKLALSKAKKGCRAPNTGMKQYHNPSTNKRIWAIDCPPGFVFGWGQEFKERVLDGMKKNPRFKILR